MTTRTNKLKDFNEIVTGEASTPVVDGRNPAAVALGRLGGLKGGNARAKVLNEQRRSEIAKIAAAARWKPLLIVGAKNMALQWSKKLTLSDAQQETMGAKMPFLRFTKGRLPHNHRKWFREVFFADAVWSTDTARVVLVEKTVVKMRVTIAGEELGVRSIRIDHSPSRAGNHSAPTTHLHYDTKTRTALESTNLAGHKVVVKYEDGEYSLEVF